MEDFFAHPFESLYNKYYSVADSIVQSSISNLISALTPVIFVGLTLYIAITGYMIIANRIQDSIYDIVIKVVKWCFIATIALESDTITNVLIGSANGLEQTILSGFSSDSENVFRTLDKTLSDGLLFAADAQSNSTGFTVFGMDTGVPDPVSFFKGVIVSAVIAIAVIVQTLGAGAIIILAKLSLLVVFALTPLMLAGLFFPQTAKFADSWFNQTFNYILTLTIAAFFAAIGAEIFGVIVEEIKTVINAGDWPIAELATLVLIAIMNYFAVKQSPSIAAGLAGGVASGTGSLIGAARATLASWTGAKNFSLHTAKAADAAATYTGVKPASKAAARFVGRQTAKPFKAAINRINNRLATRNTATGK